MAFNCPLVVFILILGAVCWFLKMLWYKVFCKNGLLKTIYFVVLLLSILYASSHLGLRIYDGGGLGF